MLGLDTRLDWEAINAVANGRDVPHQAADTSPAPLAVSVPPATDPDPLTDLLTVPIRHLTAPLPVASSILAETIYLCANDHQAATVRATGGVPYTPEEIDILWELHQAVKPEVWATRLKLIHEVKKRFQGRLEP
jgi:hypothetical protein